MNAPISFVGIGRDRDPNHRGGTEELEPTSRIELETYGLRNAPLGFNQHETSRFRLMVGNGEPPETPSNDPRGQFTGDDSERVLIRYLRARADLLAAVLQG